MSDEWLGRPDGHVFISYVREDLARANRLAATLEDAGIRVWRDTRDLWPGQDWKVEIRKAIDKGSFAFLACFSRHSEMRITSYQNEELVLAVDQLRMRRPGMPWLIPVRFDECEVPNYEIGNGRSLQNLQWIDLLGDEWAMLPRLVMAITRILSAHVDADPPRARDSADSTTDWAQAARRALELDRNRYALSLVDNGLKVKSLDADLQLLRGIALCRLGRNTEALEPLRLAHEIQPGDQNIEKELAALLIGLGEYDEAHEVSPEDARLPYRDELLGGTLDQISTAYRLWPDDQAVRERYQDTLLKKPGGIREAYELWPDDQTVIEGYREALLGDGVVGTTKAYELWPDDQVVTARYREMLFGQGLEGIRKACELWPDDGGLKERYMDVLFGSSPRFGHRSHLHFLQVDRWTPRSVKDICAVHEIWPTDPIVKKRCFSVLFQGGVEGARTAYRLWPEDLEAREHLVRALIASGDVKCAREGFRLATPNQAVEKLYVSSLNNRYRFSIDLINFLGEVYPRLPPELRSGLEYACSSMVSQAVRSLQSRYTLAEAEYLLLLLNRLAAVLPSSSFEARADIFRRDILRSASDMGNVGALILSSFLLSLLVFGIATQLFGNIGDAFVGALGAFVLGAIITCKYFRPGVVRARRSRYLSSRAGRRAGSEELLDEGFDHSV